MKNSDKPINPTDLTQGLTGLTKREYFAAMAMQALLSNPGCLDLHSENEMEWVAKHSVMQADKLLKQLESK